MPPLRLGHRGHRCAEWPEPENSLAAFDRAIAAGCDGLELDLRLSADGRVVIHHDETLRCNGETLPIASHALRSLRRLQPSLATLDQVLSRFAGSAWLDLEVKAGEAVAPAVELLRRNPPRRGFVISCFDPDVLHHLADLDPGVPRCLNLKRPCSLRRIQAAEVSWVAPQQTSCTAWYVHWLRAHGWKVLIWTVNHPSRMRLLAEAGADALVSDLPALLVATVPAGGYPEDVPPRATPAAPVASGIADEPRDGRSAPASRATRRVVSKS